MMSKMYQINPMLFLNSMVNPNPRNLNNSAYNHKK